MYRMRPLGVHLSLKSWTLWSTREGGVPHGVFISYPHPLNITSCSSPAHPVVTNTIPVGSGDFWIGLFMTNAGSVGLHHIKPV